MVGEKWLPVECQSIGVAAPIAEFEQDPMFGGLRPSLKDGSRWQRKNRPESFVK